jgi:hypothetical protein
MKNFIFNKFILKYFNKQISMFCFGPKANNLLQEASSMFDSIRENGIDASGYYTKTIHLGELERFRMACEEMGRKLKYNRNPNK